MKRIDTDTVNANVTDPFLHKDKGKIEVLKFLPPYNYLFKVTYMAVVVFHFIETHKTLISQKRRFILNIPKDTTFS